MDLYRRLDVTEKVLSIIVAITILLGVISTLVGYNFGKINSLKDIHDIKDVIDSEGQAVVEKNAGILDDIFASDAVVIHCPAPNEDRNVVH